MRRPGLDEEDEVLDLPRLRVALARLGIVYWGEEIERPRPFAAPRHNHHDDYEP